MKSKLKKWIHDIKCGFREDNKICMRYKAYGVLMSLIGFLMCAIIGFTAFCYGRNSSEKQSNVVTASASFVPQPTTDATKGLLEIYVIPSSGSDYIRYFAHVGSFTLHNFYQLDFYIEAQNNGDIYGSNMLMRVFYSGAWDLYCLPINDPTSINASLWDYCIASSTNRPEHLFEQIAMPSISYIADFGYSLSAPMVDIFYNNAIFIPPTGMVGTYEYRQVYETNVGNSMRWCSVIKYQHFTLYPQLYSSTTPVSGRLYTGISKDPWGPTILPPSSPSSTPFSITTLPIVPFNANGTISGITEEMYINYGQQQFNQGREQGIQSGYNTGYSQGYQAGLNSAERGTFVNAVSTVLGAPVTVVSQFLDFEILGYNMLAFVAGLLTLMIIIKIIRIFI